MKRLVSFLLSAAALLSLAACTLNLSLPAQGGKLIEPDEEGFAMGYEGDTLRTAFFDMTIQNPKTCAEYDGLTPSEGYQFLAADLTLYNHTDDTQPIYDTDFEVIWDLDNDDAWAWPEYSETTGPDGEPEYSVRSERQLPVESELGIHKSMTGVLLYQVPEDCKDFYIAYYEVYEPEEAGGDPVYGSSFFVRFSA